MKVSIITPSFNTRNYIKKAIESVLFQDYKNWEHIIIDGGSTDGTLDVLKEYPHLIWISEPDSGQSDAMNKGLKLASGDLIMFLNADDEFNKGWFRTLIDAFKENETLNMVVGNLTLNRHGKQEFYKPSTRFIDVLNFEKFQFPLNPVSYAYRKSLQERIGLFPTNNHYSMDYWFLLRAYFHTTPAYVDYLSGTFYIYGKNKTSNTEKAIRSLKKDRRYFILSNLNSKRVWNYLLKLKLI